MADEAPVVQDTIPEEKQPEAAPEENPEIDWKARAEEAEAKASKAAEIAENQKRRAEKAEQAAKFAPSEHSQANPDIASKDVLYLAKADIHEDDLEDVLNYSRKIGVSVSEAHKFLKPVLAERQEERRSAQAGKTGKSAHGTAKLSDEQILAKADNSALDSAEDMQALWRARMARKLPPKRR